MTDGQLSSGGIRIDLESGGPLASAEIDVFPIANDHPETIKTLDDLALSDLNLEQFPVVKDWREKLFLPEGSPEICDELPRLLTEFMRSPEARQLPPSMRRARALHHIFSNKTPLVRDSDFLPGQTTTSFVGPVVYMDTIGYCIWPELKTISTRAQNPFKISPETARRLNDEIFHFWLEHKPVQEAARYSDYNTEDYKDDARDRVNGGRYQDGPSIDPPLQKKAGETPKAQQLMERVAFFLSDKATCVSHTVPDFERLLRFGMDGLIEQARKDINNGLPGSPEQKEFVETVITVFEGAKIYAQHLADAAEQAGNTELARICRKVPAQPADTMHEALCSIWICYHLLLQENTNFGFSIGRLDQPLNRYYLNDWENLTTPDEKAAFTKHAVELVCHFFLRCSDHVPMSTEGSETLFAGSGSNQALTVGGTRYENGRVVDAVNDMTYIVLKATELLAIRDPNVHARYHKEVHNRDAQGKPLPAGKMDSYLKRVCQVNLTTRATPAIHGDAPVVHAMANYYASHEGVSEEEALADASDYASIGCIEQNASGKHYGNTGSTLMVLPAVLELALYGGKHRSDGINEKSPNLFYDKEDYTTTPLTQMKSMQEFIDAFRFQLDEMARHTAQCNNYLGRFMERDRPSPLLSGLFTGPTNTPQTSNAVFRDVAAGGAKYNSAGVAIIGLADVIDSFCVMDSPVFSGKVSPGELLAAMAVDYDAKNLKQKSLWQRLVESIRRWLSREGRVFHLPHIKKERLETIMQELRHVPKYGAGVEQTPGGIYDNSVAVKYTHLLTSMIQDVFIKYRTHRGGRYLPGYWSMTNHAGFGMLTKATPNARRDGEAFASGITPCPGVTKRNGDPVMLLDHILSVAEVDADTVLNGYTYNLSLTRRDSAYFGEDTELFSRYMKTFMGEDGVLVQMCISSLDDLKAADKAASAASQPDADEAIMAELQKYKDLMIRVAGYSAYYVTLSSQMRLEIINRSNFALNDGKEQHELVAI